jgi:hypothetical protein
MMPHLFKDEMNSVYQSAQTIQQGLEALVEDYRKCDMDLLATRATVLRDHARWMDAVLFIMLHGCDHLGRNYWKRPNRRLISRIGLCWVLLNSVQDRLDKICQGANEKRAIQLSIRNLTGDWHRFCIAIKNTNTDLKVQFSRRKKITNDRSLMN